MILGLHESAAGGCHLAFERAAGKRAEALQLFLRGTRSWKAKELSQDDVALFEAAAASSPIRHVMAHASYLINAAAPEGSAVRENSRAALQDELTRCVRLGIPGLVLHPGSHKDAAEGVRLAARMLDEVLAAVPGKTQIWLENTAGQGSCLAAKLPELGMLLEATQRSDRLGVCYDTCHSFAAGYDLSTPKGHKAALGELRAALGGSLQALRAIHLNDSKKPCGARVDRHEEIGHGTMGLAAFRELVNDPELAGVPGVLETPNPEGWADELDRLRALVRPKRSKSTTKS